MKSKIFNILLVLILFVSCSSDNSFTVVKIIDGNSFQISNGVEIELIGIENNANNELDLRSFLNTELILYDRNDKPITEFYSDKIKAVAYSPDGVCINDSLEKGKKTSTTERGDTDKEKGITIEDNLVSNKSNLSLQELFKKYKSAVFLITTSDEESSHQGSGFFISSSGIGVSNYHVFKGTTRGMEEIKLASGKILKISEVLVTNEDEDYIIFQVDYGSNLNYFNIASYMPEIGEEVFAIGNPKGLLHTLSKGIISGYRENNKSIQTTAEITFGSSGGPLLNMNGDVIGITSSGLGEANINFAINIQELPYEEYVKKKIVTNNKAVAFLLPTSSTGQIIHHEYYTLSYSEEDEQAEWVAYKIISRRINNVSRTNDFREDPYVTTGSSTLADYDEPVYDRGHLAPAKTMSLNKESMSESFYMSNMSPQIAGFNRGIWKQLEEEVRYWAGINDSLYVVTGPILSSPIDLIGENDVTVPRAFYKTIVGFKNEKIKGIAFIIPNQKSNKTIYSFAVSIDEVEDVTGIDFYYNLDNQIQNEVEANSDIKNGF